MLDGGFRSLDLGPKIWNFGFWVLDLGYWILNFAYWTLICGCVNLDLGLGLCCCHGSWDSGCWTRIFRFEFLGFGIVRTDCWIRISGREFGNWGLGILGMGFSNWNAHVSFSGFWLLDLEFWSWNLLVFMLDFRI